MLKINQDSQQALNTSAANVRNFTNQQASDINQKILDQQIKVDILSEDLNKIFDHYLKLQDINQTLHSSKKVLDTANSYLIIPMENGSRKLITLDKIHNHESALSGTFKTLKSSALEIVLDANNQIQIVKRIVTVSMMRKQIDLGYDEGNQVVEVKNCQLDGEALEKEGFTKIEFFDTQKKIQRTIYYKDYLGEDVLTLFSNSLDLPTRKTIAKKMIEQFDPEMHKDIKLENLLWDGTTLNYIDFHTNSMSVISNSFYSTSLYSEDIEGSCNKSLQKLISGEIEYPKEEKWFQLIVALYKLYSINGEGLKGFEDLSYYQCDELFYLSKANPYSELLQQSFQGKLDISNPEQLKAKLLGVL